MVHALCTSPGNTVQQIAVSRLCGKMLDLEIFDAEQQNQGSLLASWSNTIWHLAEPVLLVQTLHLELIRTTDTIQVNEQAGDMSCRV